MSSEKEKFNLTNWEIVSVNPVDKNWDWKDMFCFWSVGLQSIMSFALIASLYFVYNLNFYEVLFGSLLASSLVIYLSYIIGKPSQKHGILSSFFKSIIWISRSKIYKSNKGNSWYILFWCSNIFYF